MKINKPLKFGEFSYDEEAKTFTITTSPAEGGGGTIQLNKVYAFAFMRFVVRMAQRNWLKNPNKSKKIAKKEESPPKEVHLLELESQQPVNPNQLLFFSDDQ